MATADRIRRVSSDTLGEIEPPRLAEDLQSLLDDASVLPGVVTVQTATVLGGERAAERAMDRAVGVQLSYEGLRLTRRLIREEHRYLADDPTDSYLALVGAEVLVSRGFIELVETAVAGKAIRTVQRFSRQQTAEYDTDSAPLDDRSLEFDVIELAVDAGADVVYDSIPLAVSQAGTRLATEFEEVPLPPAEGVSSRIRAAFSDVATGPDTMPVND